MRDGERRVVVTGMGALTPIGNDVPTFWDSLVNGRSGITRITTFDPVKTASRSPARSRTGTPRRSCRRGRRNDRYVLRLGGHGRGDGRRRPANPIEDEALAWKTEALIGSGIGGINTMIRDIIEAHTEGIERVGPFLVTRSSRTWAPATSPSTPTRGAELRDGQRLLEREPRHRRVREHIRRGDADVMIAGGRRRGSARSRSRSAPCARSPRSCNDEPERPRARSTPSATAS